MEFRWYTDEEIIKTSVFEVKSTEDLSDTRLGATLNDRCATCFNEWKDCAGHNGYYRLFKPLVQPLLVQRARKEINATLSSSGNSMLKKVKVISNVLSTYGENSSSYVPFTYLDVDKGYEIKMTDDGKAPIWWRSVIPISPINMRPTCYTVERGKSDNDLTHRLSSVIRLDQALRKSYENNKKNVSEHARLASRLVTAYTLLYYPPTLRESRELSSMSDRLKGKEGRARDSLLGKRIEFSGRSVITGDPKLKLDQLGVPEYIANRLTKPIRCFAGNYTYCSTLLKNKQVKSVERDGRIYKPNLSQRRFYLRIGDVLHTRLQDGMLVLFNRQPSLWKSSVQAFKVKRLPGKTFRFNSEMTPPFNADYDGDEMNMFVPQDSYKTCGELQELCSTVNHLIIGGAGGVMDVSLGTFLLSRKHVILGKRLFFDCMLLVFDTLDHEQWQATIDKCSENDTYSGRMLLSAIIPNYVNFRDKVVNGVVIGELNKKILKNNILVDIYNHKRQDAMDFLYNLQSICNEYLRRVGFSCGVSSLQPDTPDVEESKSDIIPLDKYQTKDNFWLLKVGAHLRSIKSNSIKKLFHDDNSILTMTSEKSHSKGSIFNLVQMRCALGIQYYKGGLVKKFRGSRVLSSQDFNTSSLYDRGFVRSNFMKGLTPSESFIHSMSSRISLLDTALRTAETGYATRRLEKCLEDIIVEYDGTIRNANINVLFFDKDIFSLKHIDMEPGYAIGIECSQRVGQKIMQLTLNTFHSAGSNCATVSSGVGRLESLINMWKNKQKENRLLSQNNVDMWCGHLTIRERDCVKFKELWLNTMKLIRFKTNTDDFNNHGYKIELDEITMIKNRISPVDIQEAIAMDKDLSPLLIPVVRPKFVTLFVQKKDVNKKAIKDCLPSFTLLLKNLIIRGRPGQKVFYGRNSLQFQGVPFLKELVENVNWKEIVSNDTIEVLQTLGIEAGRASLLHEINTVFNTSVDIFFLMILVEFMTWFGDFTPITRSGLMKASDNIFKNAAFERTLKTCALGAENNIVSDFKGTSERVMLNKLVRQGTGICDVIEEKKETEQWEEEPWIPYDINEQKEEQGFVGGGGFNANAFGMMGGMMSMPMMMPMPMPMGGMLPPTMGPVLDRPPSPTWSPTDPPFVPTSPTYSPTRPSGNNYIPSSPTYSPTRPSYVSPPKSPEYDPFKAE